MKLRSSGGKSLESLAIASQTAVLLVKVPNGVQWLPGGKTVPKKGPCDFVGLIRATGRMVIFDCKQCDLKTRFVMSTSTLREHQRDELIRFGEAGALAGLLVEATALLRLYWVSWRLLVKNAPSLQWDELPSIGSSLRLVDWSMIFSLDYADNWKGGTPYGYATTTTTAREALASARLDGQTQCEPDPIHAINASIKQAAKRKGRR